MSEGQRPSRLPLEAQSHDDLLQTTRHLLADMQALSSRIAAVQEVATAINRTLELDEILRIVGQQAKWLLDFDHCSVFLVGEVERFVCLFGPEVEPSLFRRRDGSEAIAVALETGHSQLVRSPAGIPPFPSQIIFALESEGDILGTINFAAKQPDLYSQEDMRVGYLLALQLASALRNATRFQEINGLYRELEATHVSLRQLETQRDQLTQMIVHDLRSPLSVILGAIDFVNYTKSNVDYADKQAMMLDRAQVAGYRMVGMIDDMLAVSRQEAGELLIHLAPCHLADILVDRIQEYGLRSGREQKQFTATLPQLLPPVMADVNLVGRIVDNLVSNAFKYTEPDEKITLTARPDGEMVRVMVSDTGRGIAPALQTYIFDKFAQETDATGMPLRHGTGLGLTFCRMAVEAQGGQIGLRSVLNEGSTFYFTLPIATATSPQ